MPKGKPAGVRCIQLDNNNGCRLFNSPERPKLCAQFQAQRDVCGNHREQALQLINAMEKATEPL